MVVWAVCVKCCGVVVDTGTGVVCEFPCTAEDSAYSLFIGLEGKND